MPAQTFVCTVCNNEVTKPKSYSISEGKRACRIHEESQKAHSESEKKQQDRIDYEKHTNERIKLQSIPIPKETYFGPTCWCCDKPGIKAQEFMLRMSSACHKVSEISEYNAFNAPPEVWRQAILLTGEEPEERLYTCLFTLSANVYPVIKTNKMIHRDYFQAFQFSGLDVCMICSECCAKNGIDPIKDAHDSLFPNTKE